jgi:DNA-directed RNA polymerase specialized sigma24 family protein
VLAETFAVAFERRHRFRDVGRPGGAWLYGIAAKELSHWFRRFKLSRMPAGTGLERPRGDRYAEGCAIFVGAAPVYPAAGGVAVEVELWQKPAGGD